MFSFYRNHDVHDVEETKTELCASDPSLLRDRRPKV